MTFEKVLQVFHDYLEEDPMYEIVTTSHGYALMEWDETEQNWNESFHLPTPESMLEKLLNVYQMYLTWQMLCDTDREELNADERSKVAAQSEYLRRKCMEP